jgi:hypothetical protein
MSRRVTPCPGPYRRAPLQRPWPVAGPLGLQAGTHLPEVAQQDALSGDGAAPLLPRDRLQGLAPPVQEQDPEVRPDLRMLCEASTPGLHAVTSAHGDPPAPSWPFRAACRPASRRARARCSRARSCRRPSPWCRALTLVRWCWSTGARSAGSMGMENARQRRWPGQPTPTRKEPRGRR